MVKVSWVVLFVLYSVCKWVSCLCAFFSGRLMYYSIVFHGTRSVCRCFANRYSPFPSISFGWSIDDLLSREQSGFNGQGMAKYRERSPKYRLRTREPVAHGLMNKGTQSKEFSLNTTFIEGKKNILQIPGRHSIVARPVSCAQCSTFLERHGRSGRNGRNGFHYNEKSSSR
ncbi:hypothetical protein BJX64DRAFT_154481 [Aspergillus heterothallicus]